MKKIVSVDWLKEHLYDEDLILLDASFKSVDGNESHLQSETIPGARYFDIKGDFSDKSSDLPNTLLAESQFELECQKLGINKTSKIVVFDSKGIYSSPRAWWLFKTMGHDRVAVLDGGLPEWIEKGYLTESKKVEEYKLGNFKASYQEQLVKNYEDVLENLESKSFTVVDARSQGRFNGTEKEPRAHLKSGSIPDSKNIPYTTVLKNGKFKSESELKEIFESYAESGKDLVFSCGSGITACIIMLASEKVCEGNKSVFDGSWTEWAERQNLKIDQ